MVRRSTYERERDSAASMRVLAERLAAQNEVLTQIVRESQHIIATMRREGFTPVQEYAKSEPSPRLPPAVREAIRIVSDPGTQAESDATTLAWTLLNTPCENESERERHVDSVASRIIRGAPAPEGVL